MLSVLKADFKIALVWVWLLLFLLVPAALRAAAPVVYHGTVTAAKLNVRSGPSQDARVLMVLEKGTRVDVTAVKGGIGGWVTIQHKNLQGYVRNRPVYIALLPVGAAEKQQSSDTLKPDPRIQEKKQAIETRISAEEEQIDRFSQKEIHIIEGLNQIDYTLNQARIKADALSKESRHLEQSIAAIQTDRQKLAEQIQENQVYAGERLCALYRMHNIGSLDMMGMPASVFDFFVSQNAMKRVVLSDFQAIENQIQDLGKFQLLAAQLAEQREAKAKLEQDLALQIRIQEKESRKKEAILDEIRKKKALSQAAVASLKDASMRLDAKISAMGKQQAPASMSGTVFSRLKGRLPPPVNGKIVSRFGPSRSGNYNSFTFQSGIDIKVERGEPVRSVFKGEVIFAEWLKGYGNLLIIDHGENYYTLYAHVQEFFKQKGETVDSEEVIATAGDTGSIKGLCLHFEVRHHGKPMDPLKWLSKGA